MRKLFNLQETKGGIFSVVVVSFWFISSISFVIYFRFNEKWRGQKTERKYFHLDNSIRIVRPHFGALTAKMIAKISNLPEYVPEIHLAHSVWECQDAIFSSILLHWQAAKRRKWDRQCRWHRKKRSIWHGILCEIENWSLNCIKFGRYVPVCLVLSVQYSDLKLVLRKERKETKWEKNNDNNAIN